MFLSRVLTIAALLLGYFVADFACAQNFGYTPDRGASERFLHELRARRAPADDADEVHVAVLACEACPHAPELELDRLASVMLCAAGAACCAVFGGGMLHTIAHNWINDRGNTYGTPQPFPVGLTAIAVAWVTLAAALVYWSLAILYRLI